MRLSCAGTDCRCYKDELEKLCSGSYQQVLAEAIAEGILKTLDVGHTEEE